MTDNHYEEPMKLSWGKFERYSSLLFPEGVWRIGAISDGSCFFHSILTAINKSYRSLKNRSNRIQKITEVREAIAKKITRDSWEKLQNGEPAHFSLLEKLNEFETVIIKVLKNPKKYSRSKSRRWILNSFTYDKSFNIISKVLGNNFLDMNEFSKVCSVKEGGYIPMSECADIFIKQQLRIYVKKIEKCLKYIAPDCESGDIEASVLDFKNLLKNLFNKATHAALNKLVTYFSDPSEWIGTEYLSFLGNQFNVNILIINGSTGMPYIQGDNTCIKKGRSTILLLNVSECHYETLGFEVENQNNKPKIKCRLQWTHPIVQKIVNLSDKKTASTDPLYDKLYNNADADDNDNSDDNDINDDIECEINKEIEIKQQEENIFSEGEERREFSNSEESENESDSVMTESDESDED